MSTLGKTSRHNEFTSAGNCWHLLKATYLVHTPCVACGVDIDADYGIGVCMWCKNNQSTMPQNSVNSLERIEDNEPAAVSLQNVSKDNRNYWRRAKHKTKQNSGRSVVVACLWGGDVAVWSYAILSIWWGCMGSTTKTIAAHVALSTTRRLQRQIQLTYCIAKYKKTYNPVERSGLLCDSCVT